jgi:hypothetical protein
VQRAVIYIRQSLDRNGDELAVERQLAECQRLCEQRSYTVVKTPTWRRPQAASSAVCSRL